MSKKVGSHTIVFTNKPSIIGYSATAGIKEGCGNFKDYYDVILEDDLFGEKTFEHAERKIFIETIKNSISNSGLKIKDIEILVSGDLLNQIISSSFSARELGLPYLGLYGACSTMAESLAVGACLVDGKYMKNVACCTGSHFSSAERQYRFPLELGNQRPPTSQWTVTGAGCTIVSNKKSKIKIASATFGEVVDYGINDVNNMGAAMAPAASSTLVHHFVDTNTKPEDYDLIVTGDLGKLGSEILIDLMEREGYDLGNVYNDCGQMMFHDKQKSYQGASGAGCSAIVLNSYILKKMEKGEYSRVLFCATGALLSTLSSQQGDTIPGICHLVELIRSEE
ncbi:MAG: stage V sporulation protein AD [Clostridiales bacterium]|nr:stage V sporulation protein AD [Clostridiales bacterium]